MMTGQNPYWIPSSTIEEDMLVHVLTEMVRYSLALEDKKQQAEVLPMVVAPITKESESHRERQ